MKNKLDIHCKTCSKQTKQYLENFNNKMYTCSQDDLVIITNNPNTEETKLLFKSYYNSIECDVYIIKIKDKLPNFLE